MGSNCTDWAGSVRLPHRTVLSPLSYTRVWQIRNFSDHLLSDLFGPDSKFGFKKLLQFFSLLPDFPVEHPTHDREVYM